MESPARVASLQSIAAGSFAALALALGSCSRSDGPTAPVARPQLELDCVADVPTLTLTCPGASSAAKQLSLSVAFGGQGTNIQLTSTNVQYSSATNTFSADVTLQNLIEQPIGTSDGAATDASGIRVFFHSGPTVTGGTGTVAVKNADGSGAFTGPLQDFFRYLTILEPGEVSAAKSWQFDVDPTVTTFAFSVYVDAPVQYEGDHVDVDPRSVALTSDESVQSFIGVRRRVNGDVIAGPSVTWSSSDPAVASIDPNSGVLTTYAAGNVTVTATSGALSGTAKVLVYTPFSGVDDNFTATANVMIVRSAGSGPLANDGLNGATVGEVNGSAANVGVWTNTQALGRAGASGRVMLSSDGAMQYDPPPGFTGLDQITYRISSGGGSSEVITVNFTTSQAGTDLMWFICDECPSSNLGTWMNPFTSVAAFDAVNDGTTWAPQTGHSVFIAEGTYNGTNDRLTLKNGQKVYGSAIAPSSVYAVDPGSDPAFLGASASTAPGIQPSLGNTITLAIGNTIRGVTVVSPAGGKGLFTPSDFGTLTIATLRINGAGQALDLRNGTLDGSFDELRSTGGSRNISLNVVNSTSTLTFGGPADVFSGATGDAIFVNGGNISFIRPGSVSSTTANAPLRVTGHTGAITLSGTNTITTGAGLQFDNADGSYSFTGVTTLNGGSAGVNITNGSSGTFTFGDSTSIGATTSPSGTAFRVNSSSPQITYSGTLRQTNAGQLLVDIITQASGTITFQTGTLTATNGNGINLSGVTGTVNFSGPVVMSGGNAGIDVIAGSNGGITFANSSVSGISGTVLNVASSAPTLMVNGSFTASASRLIDIAGAVPAGPCGEISVGAALSASGTASGLRVANCTGGTITLSGATQTMSTGINQANTLTGNSAATAINFTGGNLNIQTTNGTAISASGAGSLTVTGNNNVINSTNGTALSLTGFTIPANGVTFQSVSSGGGTNNVALATLSGPGAINLGGGALRGAASTAFSVTGSSVGITYSGTISKTLGGSIVSVASQSANAVVFGGNLSCTSSCGGIVVTGNTGGSSTQFSGTSKLVSSIQVTNNGASGGSTTNFANGGLQLTGGNNGFSVSGGGIINVTTDLGSGNTISINGTATALSVSNTTIGSGNLNFQSISASGTFGTGIVLSNTGAGQLIVTGAGGTCTVASLTCTGGVIQNTGSDGITLTNTVNPNISFMKIVSTGGHGISGNGVVGMQLFAVAIDNAGNAANEHGLNFVIGSALTGDVDWIGLDVNEAAARPAIIANTTGSLTINVINSTFRNAYIGSPGGGVVTGGDLLQFNASGTSIITANVSNSNFFFPQLDGISAIAQGGSAAGSGGTLRLTVSGSSFRGTDVVGGSTSRRAIYIQGFFGSVVRFNVFNNTNIVNWLDDAILVQVQDNSNVQGSISSNVIGNDDTRSGSWNSRGIALKNQLGGTLVASVSNNSVKETWLGGIFVNLTGIGNAQAHITDNKVLTSPRNFADVDNVLFQRDGGTACAHVNGNNAASGTGVGNAIRLYGSTSSGPFSQQGGPAFANDAAATAYLQSQNTGTDPSRILATYPAAWSNISCASPILP